jgi:hypothetical protein
MAGTLEEGRSIPKSSSATGLFSPFEMECEVEEEHHTNDVVRPAEDLSASLIERD